MRTIPPLLLLGAFWAASASAEPIPASQSMESSSFLLAQDSAEEAVRMSKSEQRAFEEQAAKAHAVEDAIVERSRAVAKKPELLDKLLYSASFGRAEDIQLLLAQEKLSPDLRNPEGVPLMAMAAMRRDPEGIKVIQAMIDMGGDIDVRDMKGQTPLFHAASKGNSAMVGALLEKGANIYALDDNGNLARNVAFREGHKQVVQQIDAFVKTQNQQLQNVYEQYRKATEAYVQSAAELERERREAEAKQKEAERLTAEAKLKLEDERQKEDMEAAAQRLKEELNSDSMRKLREEAEAKAAEEEKKRLEAERLAQEQAKELARREEDISRQLSFESCAFEYWSFCRVVDKRTEFDDVTLDKNIRAHKEKIIEVGQLMKSEFGHDDDYLDEIVRTSQHNIHVELDEMPSNSYRAEQGVGKLEDMKKRCGKVSAILDPENPIERKKKQGAGGAAGNKGGGSGGIGAIGIGEGAGTVMGVGGKSAGGKKGGGKKGGGGSGAKKAGGGGAKTAAKPKSGATSAVKPKPAGTTAKPFTSTTQQKK